MFLRGASEMRIVKPVYSFPVSGTLDRQSRRLLRELCPGLFSNCPPGSITLVKKPTETRLSKRGKIFTILNQRQRPAKWAQLLRAGLISGRCVDFSGLCTILIKSFTVTAFPVKIFSAVLPSGYLLYDIF